jgi:hypothetical protein
LNKFIIILLDLCHPTHNLLYIYIIESKLDVWDPLCNEYIKGLDVFIGFAKKDKFNNVIGTFVVVANIAIMRKNIVWMMC